MLNGSPVWVTSERATQVCGWNNVYNGVAGIINIFCMTSWWGIYSSKKKDDMLWPDMTWVFIVAYDVWNFAIGDSPGYQRSSARVHRLPGQEARRQSL